MLVPLPGSFHRHARGMFDHRNERPRVLKIETRPPLPRVSSVSMPRCFRKMLPADEWLESSFRTNEDEFRVSPRPIVTDTDQATRTLGMDTAQ